MKTTLKVVAASVLIMCATVAQADVKQGDLKIDANLEYDTTKITDKSLEGSGRVEVNVAGRAENDNFFIASRGTALIQTTGVTVVDDAWVQLGAKVVSLKLGRFEALDLFPTVDTVLEEAGKEGYRANKLRGRIRTGQGFHSMLVVTPTSNMNVELGVVRGKNGPIAATTITKEIAGDMQGVRFAADFGLGAFRPRLGMERYETKGGHDARNGFAVGANYKLNENLAFDLSLAKSDDDSSIGFITTWGGASLGLIRDKNGDIKADTVSASYKIPFAGIKGASIIPAFSYSKPNEGDAITALRVRVRYDF